MNITRENQDSSYRAYDKCPLVADKVRYGMAKGYFTPPFIMGDYSFRELICKEDCLYPTCPFYGLDNLMELRYNHREDYDEWVVDHYKELLKQHNANHSSEQTHVPTMNYPNQDNRPTTQTSNPLMRQGKLHVEFEADQGLRRQDSDNSFIICDNQRRKVEIVPNTNGLSGYLIEPGNGYLVTIYDSITGHQTLGTKPMDIVSRGPNYIELRGINVMAITPFGLLDPENEDYAIRVYYNDREPVGVWFHRYDTGNDYLYSCARFNISSIVKNNNFMLK